MAGIVTGVLGTAALLGSAGIGGAKMIQGRKKRKEGELAANTAEVQEMALNLQNEREQKIQQGTMEALANQRMSEISSLQARYDEAAKEGIPEELKEQYLENIQGSQAQTLNANASRRGGLVGVAQADQNAVNAYKELLSMDASQKLANERTAMSFQGNAIGQMDTYANRGLNFQIGNQRQNYARDLSSNYADQDYAMALQGAGEQMMYSGAGQMVSTLGQASSFAAGGGFDGLGGGIGEGFTGTMNVPNQAPPVQQSSYFQVPQTQGFGGLQQGFQTPFSIPNPALLPNVNTGLAYGISNQGFGGLKKGFGG